MHFSPIRFAAAVVVAAGLTGVAIAPSGAASDSDSPISPTTTVSGSAPSGDSKTLAVPVETEASVLEQAAQRAFGADYAGLSLNAEGGLVVNVKGPAPVDVPAVLKGRLNAGRTYSLDELEALKAKLDSQAQALIAEGVPLSVWGVDPGSNLLSVTFERSASEKTRAEAQQVVSDTVGSGAISFGVGDPIRPGNGTRTADYSPEIGGARISGSNGLVCTSGSAWATPSNGWKMLTAGHCGDPSVYYTSGPYYYGQTIWFGGYNPNPNRIDVSVIATPGIAGYFYVNGPTSNGAVRVDASYVGSQMGVTGLRVSGSISGETFFSPGTVTATGVSIFNGVSTYDKLNRFTCSIQGGDSGAPVFAVGVDGKIIFAGIVSSYSGNTCYYTPSSVIATYYPGTPGSG